MMAFWHGISFCIAGPLWEESTHLLYFIVHYIYPLVRNNTTYCLVSRYINAFVSHFWPDDVIQNAPWDAMKYPGTSSAKNWKWYLPGWNTNVTCYLKWAQRLNIHIRSWHLKLGSICCIMYSHYVWWLSLKGRHTAIVIIQRDKIWSHMTLSFIHL